MHAIYARAIKCTHEACKQQEARSRQTLDNLLGYICIFSFKELAKLRAL